MLVDANLLLYAVHERAEQHEPVATWLTEARGWVEMRRKRVDALPWEPHTARAVELLSTAA